MLKFLPFFLFSVFVSGAYTLPAADFSTPDNISICESCGENGHDLPSESSNSDDSLPCESEEAQEEEVQEPSLLDEFNISYIPIGKMNCYHFKQFIFFAPFLNICSPPPESLSFSLLRA